jgi:putative FmdB family regulatory protein
VPIYEFVCQSCGNEFEHIQSFSDSSMPVCTQCQSVQVVRRMGRPAIHFKGSGWYINDSKKKSSDTKENKNNVKVAEDGNETKKEATTESATESKNDGKSESKSDNVTETKGGSEKKSESSSTPSTPAPVAAD